MKKFKSYIQSAWYNILHNKAYAVFCLLGTSLTFVFVILILQLTYSFTHNVVPYVNGDRVIHLTNCYANTSGDFIGGVRTNEIHSFLNYIKDQQGYALSDAQYGNIFTGNLLKSGIVTFVNGGYWKINQFRFLEGRPFTEEECNDRKPVAVIKKNMADLLFEQGNAIGQKMEFQKNTYTIIGIVEEYSSFATKNSESIWLPYVFDQFVPNQRNVFDLYILFAENISDKVMKQQVTGALKFYFKNQNQEAEIQPGTVNTIQEEKIKDFNNRLLTYGVPVILFLLLLVPAINIITLSIANTNNRAKEIAIRRAMGANKLNSFFQIITENLILVLTGTLIGLLLSTPVANLISDNFLSGGLNGDKTLMPRLDYGMIICIVLPLSFLFSLLSGGIPAYYIARKNIAVTLKGGSK